MSEFINFIKEIFFFKQNDNMRIGLSQFETEPIELTKKKTPSIKNKEVRLSDLMRRAS